MPAQRESCCQSWRSCSALRRLLMVLLLGEDFVGGEGEEVGELAGVGKALEQRDRLLDARRARQAQAIAQPGWKSKKRAVKQGFVQRRAVVEVQAAVLEPGPQLRTGDLGG